jgi:hypothetical protein
MGPEQYVLFGAVTLALFVNTHITMLRFCRRIKFKARKLVLLLHSLISTVSVATVLALIFYLFTIAGTYVQFWSVAFAFALFYAIALFVFALHWFLLTYFTDLLVRLPSFRSSVAAGWRVLASHVYTLALFTFIIVLLPSFL